MQIRRMWLIAATTFLCYLFLQFVSYSDQLIPVLVSVGMGAILVLVNLQQLIAEAIGGFLSLDGYR